MKKILLAAITATIALAMVPAHAESFRVEGDIIAMGPETKEYKGVTETAYGCGTNSLDPDVPGEVTQGADGYWIQLPAEGAADGLPVTLTTNAVDADIWWWDEGCGSMASGPTVTTLTANEAGVVPAGAAWATVDVAVGANTHFVFEVTL